MKKSNLIKIFSIIIMSITIMLFSTSVMAADSSDDFEELNLLGENENANANTNANTNANANANSNVNNNSLNFNTGNNTNNSSVYNNTNGNLPKTGIEDSIPVAMLVVVFGISSIYAYRKVKEYRNI